MQSADFGLAGSASGVISDEAEVVMKPAPALEFENVSSERAVGLFDALVAARASVLQPALSEAVSAVGVARLDAELGELVPDAALTKLASLGLRGELLFPTPSLLREKPTLIGYYRMLLGLSQKAFARLDGFKRFSAAEKSGVLSEFQKANLPAALFRAGPAPQFPGPGPGSVRPERLGRLDPLAAWRRPVWIEQQPNRRDCGSGRLRCDRGRDPDRSGKSKARSVRSQDAERSDGAHHHEHRPRHQRLT